MLHKKSNNVSYTVSAVAERKRDNWGALAACGAVTAVPRRVELARGVVGCRPHER